MAACAAATKYRETYKQPFGTDGRVFVWCAIGTDFFASLQTHFLKSVTSFEYPCK